MATSFAQHGFSAAFTTIFHPLGYAKVLIQLGHEPLAPVPTRTIFGKERLIYPNVFQYIKHIKHTDGFLGLYRGLLPRIIGGLTGSAVQAYTSQCFKNCDSSDTQAADSATSEDELVVWLKTFCKNTGEETVSRCLGIIVSQPFHVLMIRSMAQFVGGEDQYSSPITAIVEIYKNDGITGFFAGLMPRIIGEICAVWMTGFISHLINKYFIEDKEMKSYTGAACGLVITHFIYPFQLVSNIMAVNRSGLIAAQPPNMPPFDSWRQCWSQLSKQGQLKRGASLFWRYYSGPM
ncbi:hypothetical protein ScPMuIL_012810 [Solemya velum]